jgi:hypothetical protein
VKIAVTNPSDWGDIRFMKEWVKMGFDKTCLICSEADGTMGIVPKSMDKYSVDMGLTVGNG